MANGKRVKDFRPASRNANKHTARGMGALQKSIQSDGWIGAMTTAADGEMIAGSARIETVAQVFGTDAEPIVVESDGTRPVVVVRTDIPTADDKRAQRLALADNRVHEIDMSWDVEVLAGFDADVLGDLWTPEELSDLGQQWADEQRGKQEDAGAQVDKAEELRVKWGVESGQLWQLGEHRLICGDCTDAATVARVMGGERADTLVSDPPYGIGYEYTDHDDSDNKRNQILVSRAWELSPVAKVWTCGMMNLGRDLAWNHGAKVLCWHKGFAQAGNGLGGASTWEPILVVGISNATLPDDYLHFGTDRVPGLRDLHSCPKPIALFEHLIQNLAGTIVYDPFLGSGTTLIACERLGRKCRAVEISPAYCAVALERWAQTTGGTPILANGA